MTTLAPILEAFFTDRLMTQRAAAPHTIASYRDTLKLLLGYIHAQTGKLPSQLDLTDPGRRHYRRVPDPPGSRPRQQRRHP
jgi:integrase/recombinase XerD